MTKPERERLKKLDEQKSWTFPELNEMDKLMSLFYKHYGPAIHEFEDKKTA